MHLSNLSARTTCYRCNENATNVEHVPAKCFFPKEYRMNLITVPSCSIHNNETSKDDEYVRGIIVSCTGNNDIAIRHWRNAVRKSFIHSPKLFFKTFENRIENSFFHDRKRVDDVIIKISYGLYFKEKGVVWQCYPTPYYKHFFTDDMQSDIDQRLPDHLTLPEWHIFEGSNQGIFKYQFFDGVVDGKPNCIFRMIFYEGFEVIVIPRDERVELPYDYRPDALTPLKF